MPRILIVDDSRTARLGIRRMIERSGDTDLEVVGDAADGESAIRLARALAPDLITMDVHLGTEDGVDLSRRILEGVRTRVAIVTSVSPRDPELHFRALRAGALDVLAKPGGPESSPGATSTEQARFVRAPRALASVSMLRDLRMAERPAPPSPSFAGSSAPLLGARARAGRVARVLIGVSTGGPPLLESMLRDVGGPLPVPVVIVQHIAHGFGRGFARWLETTTGQKTKYCEGPTKLEPGVVYVARDDAHLHLASPESVTLGVASKPRFSVPSVDELFESAVLHDAERTLALLLTGMGSDGAEGLLALRRAHATTIAQTPETCVVGSMPRSAIDRDAASLVLPPSAIVALLRSLERNT